MVTSPEPVKLGQYLSARGLLSAEGLTAALRQQRSSGGKLGHILTHYGHVAPLALYHALSVQQGLPFIDLREREMAAELFALATPTSWLAWQAVPVEITGDTLLIATPAPDEALRARLQLLWQGRVAFAYTTPRDIRHALEQAYGARFCARGSDRLRRAAPHRSAWRPAHSRVVPWAILLLLAVIALFPLGFFWTASAFFAAVMIFKLALFVTGIRHAGIGTLEGPLLADEELPDYTILVPLYQEAECVAPLLETLRRIDYPRHKLDVKLLIEADDDATLAAAYGLKPEYLFDIIAVPYSLPRTKPKACNYALPFAHGQYVTIYDAEDRPDPLQLRKAATLFSRDPGIGCIQCRLNWYNRSENWLTRWFALEYAGWFDLLLPGLQAWKLPIPLGGTSNHMPLDLLRRIGMWDAYNVTEDADLGMRLASMGRRTVTLDSLTLEEAPLGFYPWLRQRTRWVKGYMQTWGVGMRHPARLLRKLGLRGFASFQLFIGGPCLIFLLTPPYLALGALWAGGQLDLSLGPDITPWMARVLAANLVVTLAVHWLMGAVIMRRYNWPGMALSVVLYPVYWIGHSVAAYRALWQLFFRPFHWEKTKHCVTRQVAGNFEEASSRFS